MHSKKVLKFFFMFSVCSIVAVLLFLFIIKFQTGQTLSFLFDMAGLSFYSGKAHNVEPPPELFGFNILFMFYGAWSLFVVVIWICQRMFQKSAYALVSIYQFVLFAGVVIFVVALILSAVSQAEFFWDRYRVFSNKSLSEKQEYIFKNWYRFPQMIHRDFKGRYRAELITDIDMTEDPGMAMHRTLAYFFYPIDIRGIRQPDPVEALIIVQKKHAENFVRDGFVVVGRYSDDCVIAFKEPINENAFNIK